MSSKWGLRQFEDIFNNPNNITAHRDVLKRIEMVIEHWELFHNSDVVAIAQWNKAKPCGAEIERIEMNFQEMRLKVLGTVDVPIN